VANTSLDVKIADSFRNDGDVESIISSFILQAENSHKEACLSAVEQVLTIADDLYGKDESLHNEATDISDLLLKEAGWWGTLWRKNRLEPIYQQTAKRCCEELAAQPLEEAPSFAAHRA
jgi:hypothetical protein